MREGERVSLKPTMILRTAIVTIRKYTSDVGKTIGKEEAEKDLCLPVSNNKSTVTSTTFLGINAETAVHSIAVAHVLRLIYLSVN